MAKRNLGTSREEAPVVIGLGPGFVAGLDVDAVIETSRGHALGSVILEGAAEPNTGVPGEIGGYSAERLLRAPASGRFARPPSILRSSTSVYWTPSQERWTSSPSRTTCSVIAPCSPRTSQVPSLIGCRSSENVRPARVTRTSKVTRSSTCHRGPKWNTA